MDSDLAWGNGKSGRQSWCYADTFQRSIISEAIYLFLQNHVVASHISAAGMDNIMIIAAYINQIVNQMNQSIIFLTWPKQQTAATRTTTYTQSHSNTTTIIWHLLYRIQNKVFDPAQHLSMFIFTETHGLSVGAVAAGIIAANFCAAQTDRPLLVDITQPLPAAEQHRQIR